MARKSRTPPPPKRVQAPQRRTDPGPDRRKLLILGAAGLALAALVGVAAAFALAGGDGGSGSALREAGCTLRTHPASKNFKRGVSPHVDALPPGFKYTSDPPTSGHHYNATVIWGAYDQPIDQVQAVHNLEHGGVTIQYGDDVPRSDVDELLEFYREDPNGIILAPYPKLGNKVALAAWTFDEKKRRDRAYEGDGKLAMCPGFDEDAFRAFLDAYRYKGPESNVFSPGDLEPGSA